MALRLTPPAWASQCCNGCDELDTTESAQSSYSDQIERAQMPKHFNCPPFISYDGKENPVEHVSHYMQMMSLYTQNYAFMCKVFPFSLGPMALRWFNGLRKGSIHSFRELIQEFKARFIIVSGTPAH